MAEQPSLAEFAGWLLEYLIARAGTAKLKANQIGGVTYIQVGSELFRGKTLEEAGDKLLYWLLTRCPERTPEEYAALATARLAIEKVDQERFIDELTKDGLSDFGKKVEQHRHDRGAKVFKALKDLSLPQQTSFDQILRAVREATALEDLDAAELVLAMANLQQLDPVLTN